ncbi:MAG: hypothetical protein ACJ0S4_05610 [Candidatus Rariloculaceae bacterium]
MFFEQTLVEFQLNEVDPKILRAIMKICAMLTCLGLLATDTLLAQGMGGAMGGGRGGGMGGGRGGSERLVMPNIARETMILSMPEGWRAAQPVSGEEKMDIYIFPEGQSSADWTETLRQEAYLTTVGMQSAERVYELRTASDGESCSNFTSEILEQEPENGYSMIVWRQSCQPSEDLFFSSLHKAVLGNDGLYILNKIWKYEPSNRIWRRWENYFEDVYVCDPVRTEHSCRLVRPAPGNAAGGRGQ